MKLNITGWWRQFLKYCISGGVGVLIDFLLFFLLVTFFGIQYLISNVISFSLGTMFVCYLQKNWTFRYASDKPVQLYSKYLLSIGFVFLANMFLLILGVELLHFGEIEAKLIQVVLSTLIGYFIQKNFVFTKSE